MSHISAATKSSQARDESKPKVSFQESPIIEEETEEAEASATYIASSLVQPPSSSETFLPPAPATTSNSHFFRPQAPPQQPAPAHKPFRWAILRRDKPAPATPAPNGPANGNVLFQSSITSNGFRTARRFDEQFQEASTPAAGFEPEPTPTPPPRDPAYRYQPPVAAPGDHPRFDEQFHAFGQEEEPEQGFAGAGKPHQAATRSPGGAPADTWQDSNPLSMNSRPVFIHRQDLDRYRPIGQPQPEAQWRPATSPGTPTPTQPTLVPGPLPTSPLLDRLFVEFHRSFPTVTRMLNPATNNLVFAFIQGVDSYRVEFQRGSSEPLVLVNGEKPKLKGQKAVHRKVKAIINRTVDLMSQGQ